MAKPDFFLEITQTGRESLKPRMATTIQPVQLIADPLDDKNVTLHLWPGFEA